MTKHSHAQIHHTHTRIHTEKGTRSTYIIVNVKVSKHTHTHTDTYTDTGLKTGCQGYFPQLAGPSACLHATPPPPTVSQLLPWHLWCAPTSYAVRRQLQFAHRKLFGLARVARRGQSGTRVARAVRGMCTCCKFEANSKQFELTKSCDKNCLSTLVALRMQLQNAEWVKRENKTEERREE